MAGLLGKIGIEPSQSAQAGGTFAIAMQPLGRVADRFPPTVALTPVVAKMLGKGDGEAAEDEAAEAGFFLLEARARAWVNR